MTDARSGQARTGEDGDGRVEAVLDDSNVPPDQGFLDFVDKPDGDMHEAACKIQDAARARADTRKRSEAARFIQEMWGASQVELGWRGRCGLYTFLFSVFLLWLAATSAAVTFYVTRFNEPDTVVCFGGRTAGTVDEPVAPADGQPCG